MGIQTGATVRIVSIVFLTAIFLGVSVDAGWCPEPANLGGALSNSSGATGADIYTKPGPKTYDEGEDPRDPKNMTRAQRMSILARERAAGRVTTEQEIKNFLQTGDPHLSWTPPPPKVLVKPKSMSDAQWQRILATRPKPLDYVRGTYTGSGSGRTMEQNATRNGGTLTPYPATGTPAPAASASGKPASTGNVSTGTTTPEAARYKPVTKLGVHPTQVQPTTRVFTSAAVDRVGSSQGATGGKTTTRAGAAVLEKAHSPAPTMSALDRMTGVSNSGAGNTGTKSNTRSGAGALNAPQMAPRGYITPPAQRSQDTFRQPK
jgi:hypothetical protein